MAWGQPHLGALRRERVGARGDPRGQRASHPSLQPQPARQSVDGASARPGVCWCRFARAFQPSMKSRPVIPNGAPSRRAAVADGSDTNEGGSLVACLDRLARAIAGITSSPVARPRATSIRRPTSRSPSASRRRRRGDADEYFLKVELPNDAVVPPPSSGGRKRLRRRGRRDAPRVGCGGSVPARRRPAVARRMRRSTAAER